MKKTKQVCVKILDKYSFMTAVRFTVRVRDVSVCLVQSFGSSLRFTDAVISFYGLFM